MKILHCCLSCFYVDGYYYQENALIKEHVDSGYDVQVAASTETFDNNGNLSYGRPGSYTGREGCKVTRLPYRGFLPFFLAKKFRSYKGLPELLKEFNPDIIFFHGLASFDLLVVSFYVKKRPHVTFYADSHEDFNNSARSALSRFFLYYLFYAPILSYSKRYIKKIFYITYETKIFCQKIFSLDESSLEFLPLGGTVLEDDDYMRARSSIRSKFGLSNGEIVFCQTGKLDRNKKLINSLLAFKEIASPNVRFFIAGVISQDGAVIRRLISEDPRVYFLGWLSPADLLDLLCMSDIYVQPGSQSATMQLAVCCRNAVILDDVLSHRFVYNNNGFLVNNDQELRDSFSKVLEGNRLNDYKARSLNFARNNYDYKKQAARICRVEDNV